MTDYKDRINRQVAECVGLWLAEGGVKSEGEINVCNNQISLMQLFHETLTELLPVEDYNVRLYIYTRDGEITDSPLEVDQVNYYTDEKANETYYVWRLASVELNKQWRRIVKYCKNEERYYAEILRGFFAGEGSVKTGSHGNRTVRISQLRSDFVEKLLEYFNLDYRYSERGRAYNITHLSNWKILADIKIADLHPEKKAKFWRAYNSFKEPHYRDSYLKTFIYALLNRPYCTLELSNMFNRSQARVYDVLSELQEAGKVENYRVRSRNYWIRTDQNSVIISDVKLEYLELLRKERRKAYKIARYFDVNHGSATKNLRGLERLGLVNRGEDDRWRIRKTDKKVIVIWS